MKFLLISAVVAIIVISASSFRMGGKIRSVGLPLGMSEEVDQGTRGVSPPPSSTPGSPPFTLINNACKIKVIGVGGGGGNAVNRMVSESEALGVEMWTLNTDSQAIVRSKCKNSLNIGKTTSRGLGAGGIPSVGQAAAEESRDEIIRIVSDTDLVFVTAGMGGGTGSGAAPVVAECAKEAGALTVGVVTKPFGFEGRKRMQQARAAISEVRV